MATNKSWARVGLTGGTSTDLDGISEALLNNDDIAFVKYLEISYEYIYNSSSTSAENSPSIIKPDDAGASGRWILQKGFGISNPNLLLNPKFSINQDAYDYTSSISATDYYFDGWFNMFGESSNVVSFSSGYLNLSTGGIYQIYGERKFVGSEQISGPIEGDTLTVSGDVTGTVTVYAGYGTSSSLALTLVNIGTLTSSNNSITFNADYNSSSSNILAIGFTGTGSDGIKWAKIENESSKTIFEEPSFAEELKKCKFYYQKSYNYADKATTAATAGAISFRNTTGGAATIYDSLPCKVSTMRIAPSISIYSTQTPGTVGFVWDLTSAAERSVTSINQQSDTGFSTIVIASVADGTRCIFQYVMNSRY